MRRGFLGVWGVQADGVQLEKPATRPGGFRIHEAQEQLTASTRTAELERQLESLQRDIRHLQLPTNREKTLLGV